MQYQITIIERGLGRSCRTDSVGAGWLSFGRVLVVPSSSMVYFKHLPVSDLMWVFMNGWVDWEKSVQNWVLYALLTKSWHSVVSSSSKMESSLQHGSDVHCPMEIGVKMFDLGGVIDEECHSLQGINMSYKKNILCLI